MSLKSSVRSARGPSQFIAGALDVIGTKDDPNIIIPSQFEVMAEQVFESPNQSAGKELRSFHAVSQHPTQTKRLSEQFYIAACRGFKSLEQTVRNTGNFRRWNLAEFFGEIVPAIKTDERLRKIVAEKVVANLLPNLVYDTEFKGYDLKGYSDLVIVLEKVPNLLVNIDPGIVKQILSGHLQEGGGLLPASELAMQLRKDSLLFRQAITNYEETEQRHVAFYSEEVEVLEYGWRQKKGFDLVLEFVKADSDVNAFELMRSRSYGKPDQVRAISSEDLENPALTSALQNALLRHTEATLLPEQNWVKVIAEERGLQLVS